MYIWMKVFARTLAAMCTPSHCFGAYRNEFRDAVGRDRRNVVYAIDAQSGREIWRRALGKSISRSSLSCGNINPLGITGTPVIDDVAQIIFLDLAVENEFGQHHLVFGLALKDGSILQGWPVDVAQSLSRQHIDFVARDQNQRGALAILDGTVYAPFGGHFGDCGEYYGVVVGISISDPRKVSSWATRARGGGIWAPGRS